MYLFIILIFLYNIKCDDSPVSCQECYNGITEPSPEKCSSQCVGGCKFFYSGDDDHKCVECSDLSGTNPYVTLQTQDSITSCSSLANKVEDGQKLIIENNEVVPSGQNCPSQYPNQLGDICSSEVFSTEDSSPYTIIDNASNKYDCKYLFYEENINGFIKKICLQNNEKCPTEYKYYDYENNKCLLNSCEAPNTFEKEEQNGNNKIIRCSSKCYSTDIKKEFKYEKTNASNEVIKTYCVDKCLDDKKYFKETTDEGDVKNYDCVKNCDQDYFPNKDNKCISEGGCQALLVENIANNIIICSEEEFSSCSSYYPYLYIVKSGDDIVRKYCLKTCEDTNNNNFESGSVGETYSLEDESSKECKKPNDDDVSDKKIDKKALKYVDDCKTSPSGPFFEGQYCTDCREKKIIYDTLECKDLCSGFYELDNVCYTTCPRNSEKKYGKGEKCQKCNIPEDPEHPSDDNEEGFITNGQQICYTSCGDIDNNKIFYYNKGENVCYESSTGCKSNSIYKYTINYGEGDKLKICYKSCTDIGNTYLFEYQYICYTTDTKSSITNIDSLFYYVNSTSGITKYISDSEEVAMRECFNYGLYYLDGKKCVSNCDNGKYKVLNTSNSFGICYTDDYNDCDDNDYIYHNDSSKICSKKCDSLTIIFLESTTDKTNSCLKECPDGYYQDKECCKTSCNYYIYESNKLKCADQCQYYEVDGQERKICVDKCKNNGKNIYYLPSSGKCIQSCSETSSLDPEDRLLFSYDTTEDHQPCISACPKEKGYAYYDDKNICQKSCQNYYLKIDDDYTKCVEHCDNNNKVFPGNICKGSEESCPSDAPFFFNEIIDIRNEDGTTSTITVTKCVSSCTENGFSLYKNSNKECVNTCDTGDKLKFNGVCYSSCPKGLYENEARNECVLECPNNYKEDDTDNDKLICVNGCGDKKIVNSSKKCVSVCPVGENYLDEENKLCLTSCKGFTNQFYEETNGGDGYTIYKCLKNINSCSSNEGSNKVSINGTKECISGCGKLYEYNGVCYDSCISITGASFSFGTTENGKVCKESCELPDLYYGSDKVCVTSCEQLIKNKTDDGRTCVEKCNTNDDSVRKFLVKEVDGDNEKLICKESCDDSAKRFLKSNYICIEKCVFPNNYVVEETEDGDNANIMKNECLSECPEQKPYMRQNDDGEYICSNKPCGEDGTSDQYKYYYMDKKICLKNCGQLYYYKLTEGDSTKEYCVNSCDFFKSVKLYHDESQTTSGDTTTYDNKCVENCKKNSEDNGGDRIFSKLNGYCGNNCETSDFYFESDNVCLYKCPEASKDEGQKCTYCKDFNPVKYIDEDGKCVDKCEDSLTGYIYHDEDNSNIKCLDTCGNKKIKDNVCVDSCSGDTPYIKDNICLEVCPFTKRFFINNDNSNSNIMCLFDCPNNSKYYTITENEEKTYYKCQDDCQAYVPKSYSNMNATFCFGDNKCQNDYPYYQEETISEGRIIKKCQAQCPSTLPYYVEGLTEDIECLQKCPENTIHQPNSYICMEYSKCTSNRIKYKNQECVQQCSKNEKTFEKSGISYCVDECADIPLSISEYTLLNTYDNKCVTSCDADKTENRNNFCECKGLYYIDKSTLYRQCLSSSISDCSENENYKIRVYGSDECTDYCNGVLSSSETICYPGNYSCDADSEKLITYTNGNKICECIDKYYYGINNEGKICKICLSKNANCPSTFNFLIKETNECVQECKDTYKYTFENTCVSSCDSIKNSEASQVDGKDICKCKYKYYIDKNNNIICLDENAGCPEAYPLIIEDGTGNHCVSNCIGTGYEYYFNKKCNQDCESGLTKVNDLKEDEDPYAAKYAQKKCRYNKNWYYDEITKEEKSAENNENCITLTSSNYKYKYTIFATKQCVPSCPSNYSFIFNNYCLNKCEDYTEQNIETDNETNKCVCKEKTEYIENNNNNGIIKCMTNNCDNNNEYSIVEEAHLCYKKSENKKCPSNYPFYYNNNCYSEKKCPGNTIAEPYEQKCVCKYKWYEDGDTLICLSENVNCPATHQYIISSTNKCIETNDDANLYEFNYTLYSSCPENTKEGEKDGKKICICNPNKIWFTEIIDGKEYYFCAEEKCPNNKIYQNEDSLQCLERCGTDKKVYNGICYDICPNLTEVGNDNNCVLSTVRTDLTMNNVEQTIKENILDLYKKSESEDNPITSSQKIDTPDTTIEFYGVNKKNKGDKQDNIKSDLSYIDISECVDKIYKSNGMDSTADIIILKFDIKIQSKYLVNPVEYKFINSKTGQELDASVCEHNSIKISYPLHNLISRYENMRKSRKLEYIAIELTSNDQDSLREKLDKGKEIIQEYPDTDIFNINDKIYSDICIAVEINGKDLILEDRIKFFYPQISICENNCTYNHTDFVNERIYCDCSFKKEFDFNRNDAVSSFEINSQQVNNDQGGNSNIAVLKCISNLNNSKSLSGNSGFIFMLIVIVVEVILFFIIILYGINSVLNKLNNKMKNEEEEEEHDEVDDIEVINIENTNNLDEKDKKEQYKDKDTQRALNAPPKKRGEYAMEFIPQEYVFLFFNNNEKGIIKKVEKDSVPFKVGFNTRILLEKNKNVDYNNMTSRGPFPPNQNVLVIVDDMKDDISDYIYDDNEDNEDKNGRKNSEQNNINGDNYNDKDRDKDRDKDGKKNKKNDGELISEKYKNNNKLQKYSKRKKFECTTSDYDPSDENYSELDFDEDENHEKGLIESIKKEQRLLKKDYETALQNQKNSNFVIMLFTEIIDKIYFIKILLFTRKFDILSLQFSVYFLCHTILLIFLALFYDIKTITKIWNTENYPGLGFHLLYGFLACIIVWIIYKIILCLWSNNDKIKEILRLIHANKKYGVNNQKMLEKKCNNLGWKLKLKVAIYTIIQFLLLAFCFIYLVTFCTVYTGTKDKVFQSYGIALIEILIIKILYGIALAVLRRVSLTKEKKTLYEIVLLMNTYLV